MKSSSMSLWRPRLPFQPHLVEARTTMRSRIPLLVTWREDVPEAAQDAEVEADTADTAMDAEEPSIPEMTPGDLALARGEAEAPAMPPQPVAEYLSLPAPETGGRKRACPGCGFQHFRGPDDLLRLWRFHH